MKVFVTGATGYVGSHVVPLLLAQGHKVVGLCRDEEKAEKLRKQGVEPLIGDLKDLEKLAKAAREADGVIHLAYIHDFSTPEAFAAAAHVEIAVVKNFREALKGSGKPFIGASGTAMRPPGKIFDDSDPQDDSPAMHPRIEAERQMLAMAKDNIRSMAVRFPPCVYGNNGHGFITMEIEAAKREKVSYYAGDGSKKQAFAHVEDVAQGVVLALTKGQAGAAYHLSNQFRTHKELAEAIGKLLGVEAKPVPSKEEGARIFGFLFNFGMISNDFQVGHSRATKDLGWNPKHDDVLEDVAHGSYKARA